MKKNIYISLMALAMPLVTLAQDDVYFVPSKSNVEKSSAHFGLPSGTFYSGSHRSIDDYNRRYGSYIQPIDSTGTDIITFDGARGVYPDSCEADQSDYKYTRRMSRFDDYAWDDPYRAGYYAGRASANWYWNSPWYWDDFYYGYDYWGWHNPYYYEGWRWYSPWYYDTWYWPYYRPVYGYAGRHWPRNGQRRFNNSDFIGPRNDTDKGNTTFRNFSQGNFNGQRYSNRNSNFQRQSNNFDGARSSSTRPSSFNTSPSGSFGGARSNGAFGGGSFGGGSRVGGNFGGRR